MANDSRLIGEMPILSKCSLSNVSDAPDVVIGTRRFDAGSDWIYCYNGSSNEEIFTGCGVKLASLSSGYTVDVATIDPQTLTADLLFGVCVNATISTGYYGWLMTRGVCDVATSHTIAVGGDVFQLTGSGTFETLTCETYYTAALKVRACGLYLEDGTDTSTLETAKAYIKSYWV